MEWPALLEWDPGVYALTFPWPNLLSVTAFTTPTITQSVHPQLRDHDKESDGLFDVVPLALRRGDG